nr:hypothetical protein [Vicinamibacterales bacterium]
MFHGFGVRSGLILILATFAHGVGWAQAPAGTAAVAESQSVAAPPAPVRFRGAVLFEVTAPLAGHVPADRAAAIEGRLLAVARGPSEALQAVRVVERDGFSEIYAGDTLIRTVTDEDAGRTGRTRRQLAADQAVAVHDALAVEF